MPPWGVRGKVDVGLRLSISNQICDCLRYEIVRGFRTSFSFSLVLVKEAVRRMRNDLNFLSVVDEGAANDDSEAIRSRSKSYHSLALAELFSADFISASC